MPHISRISIDDQTSDILTDAPAPVISYAIESDQTNVRVGEARICVGDWSLRTGAQTGIRYGGEPLAPFGEYIARVEVTDNHGVRATGEARFSMGFMGQPWRDGSATRPVIFERKKSRPCR